MAPSSQEDMESQRRNLAVEQSEPGSRAEIQTAGEGSVGCVGQFSVQTDLILYIVNVLQ